MKLQIFSEMVSADIKGKATPEQEAFLRQPENLADWQAELVKIINDVQQQIVELDESAELDIAKYDTPESQALLLAAKEAWERKRHQMQKFMYHADSTLLMVDQMIAANKEQASTEREHFLEQAILAHLAANDDIDKNDQNLYDALNGQWKFYEEIELPFEESK